METAAADNSVWEWIPCTYDFKQCDINGTDVYYNLSPSVTLTNPKAEGREAEAAVHITCEKNFIYSEELGWNWHKSWNIPGIKVRIDIFDPETGEKMVPPKNLYAQIYAVKAMIENLERFHLLDVGIKGENKKTVVDNEAYFSGLKFCSTSYNNDSVKFHLVACVQIDLEGDDNPRIINSFISPPVFVDSRKSARDTDKVKAKRISSLIDPFLPENLDKVFVKRENRRKDCHQEEITNNIEGLVNYFTAPNIRHKVKHPLFLAIKFSNCISLYYNTDIFHPREEDHLIEQIQSLLYESQLNPSATAGKISKVPLIVVFKNVFPSQNIKSKKVMEHLESIQSSSLQILYDPKIIPSNFKEIKNINEIKAKYKKTYAYLTSSKFKMMDSFAKDKIQIKVNDDDDSLEMEDQNDPHTMSETSSIRPGKKSSDDKQVKTPVHKQSTTPIPKVHKGGYERTVKSEYEEHLQKKVKIEDPESHHVKSEEETKEGISNRHLFPENAMEMENPNKFNMSAQLELMNRLLVLNAMMGIKPPSHQQAQSGTQSQYLNNRLPGDMGQFEALVQGILGQKQKKNTTKSQRVQHSSSTATSNSIRSPLLTASDQTTNSQSLPTANQSSKNGPKKEPPSKTLQASEGDQLGSVHGLSNLGYYPPGLGRFPPFPIQSGLAQSILQSLYNPSNPLAGNLSSLSSMMFHNNLGAFPNVPNDLQKATTAPQESQKQPFHSIPTKLEDGTDSVHQSSSEIKEEDKLH